MSFPSEGAGTTIHKIAELFGLGEEKTLLGVENVIVLATPHKLMETAVLMVDTGSDELDEKLSGYMSVVCGYRMAQRKEVRKG